MRIARILLVRGRYARGELHRLVYIISPPLHLDTPGSHPLRRQRWVLNGLHNFDRRTIGDWVSLMVGHVQRPNGATPMADYAVQLVGWAADVRSARRKHWPPMVILLAAHCWLMPPLTFKQL
jgi:hypothetical protein